MKRRSVIRSAVYSGIMFGLAIAAIGGCAIGPNYERPKDLPDAPAFRGEQTPAEKSFVEELPWWEIFDDPALVDLTQVALANNRDLAVAAARVEQARYFVGVARSDLFPQLGYDVETGRGEGSENINGLGRSDNLFVGAVNLAWEIDIWGRIRRATQAARAELMATEAVERGVRLSLIAGVASAYFELCELDRELAIAQRTAETFRKSRDLFLRQFQGGTASRLAVERAEGALGATESTIPELESRIVAKENELSVLLGRPAGEIPRGNTLADQRQPPVVPAGIPAELLERRPDLVQAEQVLVAANARVGESIANFLPRIGLTSFFGHQSNELSDFLDGGSRAWSVAGTFAGPIFQGGRNWSLFKASKAEREAATRLYDQQVLIALREVSDSLVAWDRLAFAREAQARAVTAYEESVRLSQTRYWGGLATYFEVLESQQLLFPAELRLAQIELARLRSLVQLYKALGGGWSLDMLPGDEAVAEASTSAEAALEPNSESTSEPISAPAPEGEPRAAP